MNRVRSYLLSMVGLVWMAGVAGAEGIESLDQIAEAKTPPQHSFKDFNSYLSEWFPKTDSAYEIKNFDAYWFLVLGNRFEFLKMVDEPFYSQFSNPDATEYSRHQLKQKILSNPSFQKTFNTLRAFLSNKELLFTTTYKDKDQLTFVNGEFRYTIDREGLGIITPVRG